MNINPKLKKYIEENIFPIYEKNDSAHNIDHINYVIERSLKFSSTIFNINFDMVYTVASYHDIAHHIDSKNHELLSSEVLQNDKNLRDCFQEDQIKQMRLAIIDHRASSLDAPRNIYGKIISSADRTTSIKDTLSRTYEYTKSHNPNMSLEEMMEKCLTHITKKFGKEGYAKTKMYFQDDEYTKYLEEIDKLINNKEEFKRLWIEINNLEDKANTSSFVLTRKK